MVLLVKQRHLIILEPLNHSKRSEEQYLNTKHFTNCPESLQNSGMDICNKHNFLQFLIIMVSSHFISRIEWPNKIYNKLIIVYSDFLVTNILTACNERRHLSVEKTAEYLHTGHIRKRSYTILISDKFLILPLGLV